MRADIPPDMEQWQPTWRPHITVFRTGNKVPITTYSDEFGWRCHKCGWVGLGHYAPTVCRDEGVRHQCPPPDDACRSCGMPWDQCNPTPIADLDGPTADCCARCDHSTDGAV